MNCSESYYCYIIYIVDTDFLLPDVFIKQFVDNLFLVITNIIWMLNVQLHFDLFMIISLSSLQIIIWLYLHFNCFGELSFSSVGLNLVCSGEKNSIWNIEWTIKHLSLNCYIPSIIHTYLEWDLQISISTYTTSERNYIS